MKKRIMKTIALVCAFCLLTGCSMNHVKEQNDTSASRTASASKDNKITVVSREEWSGTRDAFVQITGVLQTDDEGRKIDQTTDQAVIASNAEDMIKQVASNETAIGYVSLGEYLNRKDENIRAIDVNGVAATKKNVEKESYVLSRPFNLAYSGKLNDLEEEFLRYVMSKGQRTISQSYVSVKKEESFLSLKPEGTIIVNGSTSMAPVMKELAKDYMKENPNATVQIQVTDSTNGLTAAMQNSCDFAMASRDLKDYEQELLTYKTIAKDGIAVVVNKKNTIKDISLKQLKQVFTGEIHSLNEEEQ